jgi:hypothetical protein
MGSTSSVSMRETTSGPPYFVATTAVIFMGATLPVAP